MIMSRTSKRSIVFIGIPAFPIAVERAVSRWLWNRPVAVVKTESPRSPCIAVSSEARQYGVRVGMRLNDAKRHCRDLTLLQPNPSLYQRAMNATQRVIAEYTPLSEPARPGQNYLDLTGSNWLFGGALPAADRIRTTIMQNLRLPADAGIATNKLVSRVAAIDADPEGLVEVEQGKEETFLAPHKISVLPAADRKLRARLVELNLLYIHQVKEIDIDILVTAIGPAALLLSKQSRGIDPSPILPPAKPPCIVNSEELTEDTNDPEIIESVTSRLLIESVFRLQRSQSEASLIVLKLTYSDGRTTEGSHRLRKHTNDGSIWLKEVVDLLKRIRTRRVRIRHVELTFKRLVNYVEQLNLNLSGRGVKNHAHAGVINAVSTGLERSNQTDSRFDRALKALAIVRERYGDSALRLGN